MGINDKFIDKYNKHYEGLKTSIPCFVFDTSSELYFEEVWMPISGRYIPNVIENAYLVSNYGKIYTKIKSPCYPNGGIMVPSHNNKGYQQINLLSNDHKKIGCKVSRLVMLHFRFVENCQYFEVDHLDGNKDNNTIWNLEWVTPQENSHRAINNNLRPISCNKNDTNYKLLTDEEAHDLYNDACNGLPYDEIANKYGVSEKYVYGLYSGYIRPYIRGKYYNRRHV